ncbi:MAG TPA: DUF6319 family protein [Pseudonocardiaceae bacterium]|jgi:hypothetical protein|nr:DUF6319 family protein [Pseudonocardiaceae bacterium]
MPSPSRPSPLSDDQLATIRTELAADRNPAVWFTPAAVGVDAGRSAKVMSLGEPAEGDFIQVKPTGSRDVLSFSPSELTMEKPPRGRKVEPPAAPARKPEPAPAPVDELLVVRERPVRKPVERAAAPVDAEPAAARPTASRAGRGKQPSPLTVTLSSTEEGEWTVEVVTGKKRTIRPTPISASSVAHAARALGDEVAEAIEGVLTAARDQQRARVAQLQAELDAARQALADLSE